MPDPKRTIVPLNDLTRLINEYSTGNIEDVLASLDPMNAGTEQCDCRCGCVGVNCDCRGQVGQVSIDDESWRKLQEGRESLAERLRQQFNFE
ncbi:hypothetical protein [Sphingomonas colocasiae]|uniref:Post-SET domain-containing protein n=1 Tax=Sphingomonas colocasiae TaxID=1848973 RepID=A0ABS7PYS4_9SPHN|nr:hypothetical protein [Sphingomonas colocasiae]MBY8825134.1 hypothetical protein [Sphingomonas colocasiae]